MNTTTIHRARIVLPVSGPAIVDGAVAVRGGRIVSVGAHDEVTARLLGEGVALERHEWDGVLTPGLVNAHTHLQYTEMAEVGRGEYGSFEEWAVAFGAVYPQPHDWAASAADGAAQLLRSGTTAAADIVTDIEAGSALHDAGLHGIAFWEVFGWRAQRWQQEGRRSLLAALSRLPAPPAAGVSPHAVYSIDAEVFRDVAAFADEHGLRQHIHAAESASEDEFTRTGTGPLADRAQEIGHDDLEVLAMGGSGLGAIRYLDSVGALTPTTHLAHGIYVSAEDRALLRERGVAVALCPRSNAVIGLDPPPVAAYLTEGNLVAVGTDSLSSAPSLDLLEDVAALHAIAGEQGYRARDLHERLFEAATLGGARALGLGDAGALSVGNRGDLAVFGIPTNEPSDALAQLVEGGDHPVLATIVAGVTKWSIDG